MASFSIPRTSQLRRPLCTTSEPIRSHSTKKFDCFRCLWRLRCMLLQNIGADHIKDVVNVVGISGTRLQETHPQFLCQFLPFFARDYPLGRKITLIAYKKCYSS